jgi:hypothetical protein
VIGAACLLWAATLDPGALPACDQPADAFSQVHGPLIELYARHVTPARLLAEELRTVDPAAIAKPGGLER